MATAAPMMMTPDQLDALAELKEAIVTMRDILTEPHWPTLFRATLAAALDEIDRAASAGNVERMNELLDRVALRLGETAC